MGCHWHRRWGLLEETLLLLIASPIGEDFTLAKKFEHGVLTDGTTLPGLHHCREFEGSHPLGIVIRVQLKEDLLIRDIIGGGFRGIPPIHPTQHLGDGLTDTGGKIGKNAVLTCLA